MLADSPFCSAIRLSLEGIPEGWVKTDLSPHGHCYVEPFCAWVPPEEKVRRESLVEEMRLAVLSANVRSLVDPAGRE